MKNNVEILAPAGSFECLKAAVRGGANAVYLGGSKFGARAFADNFTEETLIEAIEYAHLYQVKIYLTVNTLFKNTELEELYDYLLPYYKAGLDAVIVQDLGVINYIRRQFPDLAVHVSTQATVTNYRSALYFKEKGATRIVPARELSIQEVKKIKEETGLEVECFVHGALCYCYSGQCLLSSYIGGRSGNRGKCAQPCRLSYKLKNDPKHAYDYLSLKDLCTIEMIPELVGAGIDSFKIEGRMKQPEYVYIVSKMYRKYTDLYFEKGKEKFHVDPSDLQTLQNAYQRRGYTQGYYKQHNGKNMLSLKQPNMKNSQDQSKQILVPASDEKIGIKAKVVFSSTTNTKFYINYKNLDIMVEGNKAENAKSAPVTKERIISQLKKTGNTAFQFNRIEVEMNEDLFVPMQHLNDLRRRGLEELKDKVLSLYQRPYVQKISLAEVLEPSKEKNSSEIFTALVTTYDQLSEVGKHALISLIYIDFALALSEHFDLNEFRKKTSQKIYLAMPYIFREDTIRSFEGKYKKLEEFDGLLVRNMESLLWLKEKGYEKDIHADDHVYTFNELSKKNIQSLGVSIFTAPTELNFGELKNLDLSSGTFTLYGHQPAMITANCLVKTSGVCKHSSTVLYLIDRQKKNMPVRTCCKACYNLIYNSQPHMLLGQMDKIRSLHANQYRLDFTIESKSLTDKLLKQFDEFVKSGEIGDFKNIDYTNGHFRRGVK